VDGHSLTIHVKHIRDDLHTNSVNTVKVDANLISKPHPPLRRCGNETCSRPALDWIPELAENAASLRGLYINGRVALPSDASSWVSRSRYMGCFVASSHFSS